MALSIVEAVGRSDVGRQRQTNEDSYLESSPVFGVADGMGGARAGEVASQIAVETLEASTGDQKHGEGEARLAETARAANQRIYELAQSDESRSGMGTTFTAVLVEDGKVVTGHVGDSRLYRWRAGELERLTRDHSLVEELVRRGELDPEDAKDHPQRSIITRALGPEPEVEVETFTCPGRAADVYLLCSDGLTTMISEQRLAEVLGESPSLEQAAERLVELANEAGGRDNVTVVLFRLGEEDGGVAAADTLSGQDTSADLKADEVRAAVTDAGTAVRPAAGDKAPRRRRWATRLGVLLLLAAIVAGGLLGARQVWFVGADDSGFVTLYRGLPWDLPFGLDLYSEEYVSEVAAESIGPPERRDAIVDEQLRGHDDAADLVQQVEEDTLAAPTPDPTSDPAGRPSADGQDATGGSGTR